MLRRDQPIVRGDAAALVWRVRVRDGDAAADLTGASASLYCARLGDGEADYGTTYSAASASGDTVTATLPSDAANVAGPVLCVMRITSGGAVIAVARMLVTAIDPLGGEIIDEGKRVPSLDEIAAAMENIEKATSAANTATTNANNATTKANDAATSATSAATRANASADDADAAAAAIDGMTASALALAAGSAATAAVRDVDGHKHIDIGVPRGDTGAVPAITFTASTGEPGTQVQLSQGGTVDAPTVHLTIPRGDTGAVEGIDYYAGAPAALGTGSPGTANGVARGDHVHPMPTAAHVGARADTWMPTAADVGARADTWMPTAADVGALASGGTAANASKLGGKTLSDILLAIYPVGAIYISTVSTSPATLFGGTWTQIKDRFLLAAGDTYSPGWEAGQAEVTLTVENLPAHTHRLNGHAWNWGTKSGYSNPIYIADTDANAGYTTSNGLGTDQGVGNATQATGGGQAHDNMPPYVAVYMWKRTA